MNEAKSFVGRPWKSKYLGFSLTSTRTQLRIKLHWKTLDRLKAKIRELTGRQRGRSLLTTPAELNEYLRGWWGYFSAMETPYQLARLAGWIRRRLRSYIWKQWKNRRTRAGNLMKLGIYRETAVKTGCARKGAWRMSQVKWVMIALPNRYFTSRGLAVPWD